MLNLSIFKSYDIRGIYPVQLNKKAAYEIGRLFAKKTNLKKIAIARDGRLSSNILFKFLSQGINEAGADVYDIGQTPTECLYFSVGKYPQIKGGIMITASHNPKEYNGFKMIKKTKNKEIEVIRGKDLVKILEKGKELKQNPKKGEIYKKNIWNDYLTYILKIIKPEKIKPFRIAVDASNGMAAKIIPLLEKKLNLKIIPLNFEINGNFPGHGPNPLQPGALKQIKKTIKQKKAHFGIIFDGDADRLFLLDEKSEFIPADITLLFLAKYFLKKYPGAAISYNTICSKAVPYFIQKWGGRAIRTKVGFVNVRQGIIENKGIMGGELSGHYCFKDFFYFDSGMIAFLALLKILSSNQKSISELKKEYSIYYKLSEINFKIKNKEKLLEKIKEKYIDGKQDYLDGVSVEYKNWWFNLRPSQTEPVLRLTLEAKTPQILEQKRKELSSLIKKEK